MLARWTPEAERPESATAQSHDASAIRALRPSFAGCGIEPRLEIVAIGSVSETNAGVLRCRGGCGPTV